MDFMFFLLTFRPEALANGVKQEITSNAVYCYS